MGGTCFRIACATVLLSGLIAVPRHVTAAVERIPVVPLVGSSSLLPTSTLANQEGSSAQSAAPNLAGTYDCAPQKACEWLGATITITQSGNKLELKSAKGETAFGEVTSAVSVTAGPPMNMLGAISSDGRTLDWSNGSKWTRK